METKREGISNQDIEAAWSKEIERRVAEIHAGTVELVPWEEVREELFDCPADAHIKPITK
jgi:putative addiction module component (TIGR02574 family)